MITKWMTAAAAASALSTAMPASAAPQRTLPAENRPFTHPESERARIVYIATEVRRLVARSIDADPRSVVAPLVLADLGLSEGALADVVFGLETQFDLDIDDAAPRTWETVGDVVAFVARRLREPRTSPRAARVSPEVERSGRVNHPTESR
jgi:acyl carrier protein